MEFLKKNWVFIAIGAVLLLTPIGGKLLDKVKSLF